MSSRKKQELCAAKLHGTEHFSRRGRRAALFLSPIAAVLVAFSSSAPALQNATPQPLDNTYALLRRIMPGASRAEIQAAASMGFQNFLDQQLDYTSSALPSAEAGVDANWELATWTPSQIDTELNSTGTTYDEVDCNKHMRRARIYRWLNSKKSFYEVMTWFWFNHFNVDQNAETERWGYLLTADYDKQVCRDSPFGRFRRMVKRSAGWVESNGTNEAGPTAMLAYLDNYLSQCGGMTNAIPNENYARELMELHLVGTNPQIYGEQDVKNLARMLSGWSVRISNQTDRNFFRFEFNDSFHCYPSNPYPWFGITIGNQPGNGIQEAKMAINRLINYQDPVTGHVCANFIARKLVSALLTDVPDAKATPSQLAVINQARQDAAAAFGVHGEIEDMVRAILTEANVDAVLDSTNPMYKYMSPWKFITSAVRAADATVTPQGIATLDGVMSQNLAQAPFEFAPPIGYSDAVGVWAQNQPKRWDFVYRLFERAGTIYGTHPGVTVDVDQLYAPLGGFTASSAGTQVNLILTGGNMRPEDVQAITDFALASTDPPDDIKWKCLALGCLAPSFNLY